MKNIKSEDFQVSAPISLVDTPTFLDIKTSEKKKEKELQKVREKLSKIQDKMYAHNRYSVLICIQGMDTAGKDSLIREVFKEFNARGVVVHSFKKPNSSELEHDFLWRHYIALPEKGKFTVFNRSHYENVLISKVKPQILLSENIPGIEEIENIPNDFWEHRLESILDFEKHLSRNGMIIMKFFLHLGKDEQKNRLMRRLEKAKHHWKFSPDDLNEREHWDTYLENYEDLINKTSKPHAPWFVIPADNKETARYMVAKTILDTMEKYTDIEEPALNENIQKNLEMYRFKLENS